MLHTMSRDKSIDVVGSVVDLAIEYPQLLSILQGLGIDYTCGGRSLRTACDQRGLNACDVVQLCENCLLESAL